ncbi:hypothetical protein B4098_3107 [Heyndrickxia coagulans]|uniref:Uncharacterized protein n=1 Tax=Heyndrickxia coagulans TaxID=1398 RepID=A0A150JU90_HEYCO|nr:hypothetical protein B4098_3107 [Heyndrickxia coagulans]
MSTHPFFVSAFSFSSIYLKISHREHDRRFQPSSSKTCKAPFVARLEPAFGNSKSSL